MNKTRIIKELIGPEAEQHGFFLVKNAPNGAFKKMLASYEKKIDELYWQGFDIEYDSSQNDELVLRAEGINKRIAFVKMIRHHSVMLLQSSLKSCMRPDIAILKMMRRNLAFFRLNMDIFLKIIENWRISFAVLTL